MRVQIKTKEKYSWKWDEVGGRGVKRWVMIDLFSFGVESRYCGTFLVKYEGTRMDMGCDLGHTRTINFVGVD